MDRRLVLASLGASVILAACVGTAHGPDGGDSASSSASAPPARSAAVSPVASVVPMPVAATPVLDEGPIIGPTIADTAPSDQATIARLEREARAIAKTTGCSAANACRVAPVGAKACGGPRSYLVYCAASTDTLALVRKLRQLERAERRYNEKLGMMSTCEMRVAPTKELIGGVCRERPAGP